MVPEYLYELVSIRKSSLKLKSPSQMPGATVSDQIIWWLYV